MKSDWKAVPLSEVCDFQNGFAFSPSDYTERREDTWQVFRMGSIERGGGLKEDNNPVYVSKALDSKIGRYVLNEGDIAIAMTDMKNSMALLAHTAYIHVSGKYVLNQRVGRITAKDQNILNPRFFYYFSNTPEQIHYLRSRANSGVQVNLSTEAIKGSLVLLPPIDEQRVIARILGTLDDKIELNRRMNETLEAMARAFFKSWFVDFDPVRAKAEKRQPAGMDAETAALFPNSLEVSALGKIPKGWGVGSLLKHAKLISGGTPSTAVAKYWGGEIPWASAKDVSQCGECFLISTERKITEQGLAGSATKIIAPFSTVVVARGATTGRLVMFGLPIAMNQTCYALRSMLEAHFYLYCQAQQVMHSLVHSAHGSVFNTITTRTFDTTKVLIPSDEIILSFERVVGPLFKMILSLQHESQTLASIRDALLPKLLSGEIRVCEAEREVEQVA